MLAFIAAMHLNWHLSGPRRALAWRGGAVVFMRALLASYGDSSRVVWVADSFGGVPKPKSRTLPR